MHSGKTRRGMRAGGMVAALAVAISAIALAPPASADVVDQPWMDTSLSADQRAQLLSPR